MAEAIRERQRENPGVYLGEVYRYILQDESLLASLAQEAASEQGGQPIQDAAAWIKDTGDSMDEKQRRRVKALLSCLSSSTPTVLQGGAEWRQWAPLLHDLFFWFEYLQEDSGGQTSNWPFTGYCSSFSHAVNARIPLEQRAFYSQMWLPDCKGVNRGEVLKTLAYDADVLQRSGNSLTASQNALVDMSKINEHLLDNLWSKNNTQSPKSPRGDDLPPSRSVGTPMLSLSPGVRSRSGSTGSGVPVDVSLPPSVTVEAMRDGEIVVRLFGMKDIDSFFTGGNLLVEEVTASCRPATRTRSRSSSGLARYSKAIGKSVLGKALTVHAGFWQCFQDLNAGCLDTYGVDVPDRVVQLWSEQEEQFPDTPNRRIVLTGHSMGAALACFVAYCIFTRYEKLMPSIAADMHLVLFGAPRFARVKFTNWMNKRFAGRIVRLELKGDRVASLPPLPGWFAPGSRIQLSRKPLEQAIAQVGQGSALDTHHFSYWSVVRHAAIQLSVSPESCTTLTEVIEDGNFKALLRQGNVEALRSVDTSVLRMTVAHFRDQFDQNCLHIATSADSPELLEVLLDAGAHINKRDNCHWTPLHRACGDGRWRAAVCLLEHGAIPDARTHSGSTAMHFLCKHPPSPDHIRGLCRVARAIIAVGVDLDARNANGETPLLRAVSVYNPASCSLELVNILLDHGASVVSHKTVVHRPAGYTLLHYAVHAACPALMAQMLERGCDPQLRVAVSGGVLAPSALQLAHTLALAHDTDDAQEVLRLLESHGS